MGRVQETQGTSLGRPKEDDNRTARARTNAKEKIKTKAKGKTKIKATVKAETKVEEKEIMQR